MKFSFENALLTIIAAYVSFCFITAKFTNDVAIFMGVENIADKFYPFPQGIDLAWEAKPIGNRIINYALLKLAELVVPFSDAVNFAIVAKAIALAFLIFVAAYIAYILGGRYTFWIIFFAFTTCCNFCIMQAEWWAVLLSLAALACMMHDNPHAPYIAGFLFIFIGMIKGITAFLFIPTLCGVYLLGKPQQNAIVKVLCGVLATTVVVCIAQLTIWPNMLPDLLLAPVITGVGRLGLYDQTVMFVGQSITSMFYIPVLIVGLGATGVLLFSGYFKEWESLAIFSGMWLSVMALVFVHSEFFAYQFLVYVLPSIVTILLGLRRIDAIE
jgi:hypothetical protein